MRCRCCCWTCAIPKALQKTSGVFGRDFLFRQDAQRILFWGRIPALLLSLGMASLVAMWATHLWGWGGRATCLVSLCL